MPSPKAYQFEAYFARQPFRIAKCSESDLEIMTLFHWYIMTPYLGSEKELRLAKFRNYLDTDAGFLSQCRLRMLSTDNKNEIRAERLVLYNQQHGPELIVRFHMENCKAKSEPGLILFDELKKIKIPGFKDDNPLNLTRENLWT